MSRNFLDRQAMESSSENDNEIIIAGAAVAVLGAVGAKEENKL